MKKISILIFAGVMLSACAKHKIVRNIPLSNYYSEITAAQADSMMKEFNKNNRFKKALAVLQPNPTKELDSTFVRLQGFAVKREILEEMLSKPEVKGIAMHFGQNGYDKKGLRKRPNVNLILSALDASGFRIFGYKIYDKLPSCPECNIFQ
jgi:hypothetical protein